MIYRPERSLIELNSYENQTWFDALRECFNDGGIVPDSVKHVLTSGNNDGDSSDSLSINEYDTESDDENIPDELPDFVHARFLRQIKQEIPLRHYDFHQYWTAIPDLAINAYNLVGNHCGTIDLNIVLFIHMSYGESIVKVCAPTGTAAFDIMGNTIHNALSLPVPIP